MGPDGVEAGVGRGERVGGGAVGEGGSQLASRGVLSHLGEGGEGEVSSEDPFQALSRSVFNTKHPHLAD